jgi:acyl-CoA thioesterase
MKMKINVVPAPSARPGTPYPPRAMETRFDRDTRVRPIGEGLYEARLDEGWWVVRGPNGGYLAAVLVNALTAAVADPARAARSLTIHYVRPPRAGPVRIETVRERVGRSLTTVSARMVQEGRLQALALAAFSTARETPSLHQSVMPEVPAPEALAPRRSETPIPIHERFEQRPALGGSPFEGVRTAAALTGGWRRLAEPRPVDAALLAAYVDAWPPAVFSCRDLPMPVGGVPTVDLTVHFRALPPAGTPPGEPVLAVFRTREVHDGFLEEDGEIWSRGGVLLAQSRQLAVLV